MADAKPKGGGGKKRKAGSEEDDSVIDVDGEKPKDKKEKKAAKGPPKPKAAPKLKPFTPEQEEIAKGASMERNKAMADFLDGIRNQLKEQVRGAHFSLLCFVELVPRLLFTPQTIVFHTSCFFF